MNGYVYDAIGCLAHGPHHLLVRALHSAGYRAVVRWDPTWGNEGDLVRYATPGGAVAVLGIYDLNEAGTPPPPMTEAQITAAIA